MVTRKEYAEKFKAILENGPLYDVFDVSGHYTWPDDRPQTPMPSWVAFALWDLFDEDNKDSVAAALRFMAAFGVLDGVEVHWNRLLRRHMARCIECIRGIVAKEFGTSASWWETLNCYCDEALMLVLAEGEMDRAACDALGERIRLHNYMPDDVWEIVSSAHVIVYLALQPSLDEVNGAPGIVRGAVDEILKAGISAHSSERMARASLVPLFAGLAEDLEALVQANNSSKGA